MGVRLTDDCKGEFLYLRMQGLAGDQSTVSLVRKVLGETGLQPAGATLQGKGWLGQLCRAGSQYWGR